MNYEMRRKEREISREEAIHILENGEYGILATVGEDGYPYGVPISYAYVDEKIYFHCAKDVGHKIDNLVFNPKASFTVVGDTEVLPDKFSTKYESAIAFGVVKPCEDKLVGLEYIRAKYSPDFEEKGLKYAKASEMTVGVYELQIEQITGKARR